MQSTIIPEQVAFNAILGVIGIEIVNGMMVLVINPRDARYVPSNERVYMKDTDFVVDHRDGQFWLSRTKSTRGYPLELLRCALQMTDDINTRDVLLEFRETHTHNYPDIAICSDGPCTSRALQLPASNSCSYCRMTRC